jgi:hypothetical protein
MGPRAENVQLEDWSHVIGRQPEEPFVKAILLFAVVTCLVGTGCSIRSERVVEKPVPAERTVVHDTTTVPATTTVYSR